MIQKISDIEEVNLKEEIRNKRSRVYYFSLQEKDKFLKVMKEIQQEKLFHKYNMTASYMIEDDCISIAIYRAMDFMI